MRVIPSSYINGASHASVVGADVEGLVVEGLVVTELVDPMLPVPEPVVAELDEVNTALPPPELHPEIMIARTVQNTSEGRAPMRALPHISASFSGSKKMSFMEPMTGRVLPEPSVSIG